MAVQIASAVVTIVHDVIEMGMWGTESLCKSGSKNAVKKELNIDERFIFNLRIS
jgi:hypothetical protein